MNLLEAVKQECRYTLNVLKARVSSDSDGIHYGAMTPSITARMNTRMNGSNIARLTIRQCRERLKKLERNGVLISRPTPGGLTRWWPVGFADGANTTENES